VGIHEVSAQTTPPAPLVRCKDTFILPQGRTATPPAWHTACFRARHEKGSSRMQSDKVLAAAATLPLEAIPRVRTATGFDFLAGVKVLDLTTSVAGPFATMLLGDMGAGIIKIERPGQGDDARAWGPPFLDGESLWFLSVNRNKQSVALDYSTPPGRDVL